MTCYAKSPMDYSFSGLGSTEVDLGTWCDIVNQFDSLGEVHVTHRLGAKL